VHIRSVAIAVLLLSTGCDGATGSVQGGTATLCAPSNGGSTWTDLYADYFGPCGRAGCSGQGECHENASSPGVLFSGFICGTTQESCWEGMTIGIAPDAGGVYPAIVTGGELVSALHKSPPAAQNLNNMPCEAAAAAVFACSPTSSSYAFTPADLARISSWIQQGAQDN
jgi:hypothetical protein